MWQSSQRQGRGTSCENRQYTHAPDWLVLASGQDNLYPGIFVPGAVDDRLQVAFGIGQRQAPQPVIRAQCQDEDRNRALQDPVDATQPASGGFAAEASVDDLKIPATYGDLAWIRAGNACAGSSP